MELTGVNVLRFCFVWELFAFLEKTKLAYFIQIQLFTWDKWQYQQ